MTTTPSKEPATMMPSTLQSPEQASHCGTGERLRLVGVTKRYGAATAVRDVNLRVAEGEFLTFLGQSGSGKTTTLKLVAGFETCDAGSILLAGQDVSTKPPRDRDIGMVFQNYALFPQMSVQANIAYGLRRRRWQKAKLHARVDEMLELVGLGAHAAKLPRQLSGGQQQRVALARALAPEPKLLLMDEPLGALDRALRLDLETEIRRIHQRTGCTVIYVTHDRDEALALSDRIAVFHDGEVVAVDEPPRLYADPPTVYVARLLTDANLAPLPTVHTRDGDHVVLHLDGQPCRIRTTASQATQIAVPRRAISFQPGGGSQVRLPAVVTDVVFLGELVRVDLDVRGLGPMVAHVPNQENPLLMHGNNVAACIDTDLCRVVA